MPPHRLALLACTIVLAACSEGPFVDHDLTKSINKPVDSVVDRGVVAICYGDSGQLAEAEALARRTCGAYGLQATLVTNDRFQCRLLTPHRLTFRCFHPDLVNQRGDHINPFDEAAMRAWRARTGKEPPATLRRNPEAPGPSAEGAATIAPSPGPPPEPSPEAPPEPPPAAIEPAPAPVPQSTPAPADIPAWPQPPAPAPIAVPAPLDPGGFTLPVGTWGDAFDAQH